MKCLLFFLFLLIAGMPSISNAQFASQKDATYIATLKVVTDYKIDDEENLREMEQLRNDEKFNKKLEKMLNKLHNNRTKTGKNKQVYNVLLKAGREIYDILK